ncbi:MAG: GntR family transcriptional regulator [Lentisphaerae bacterium]|nr:GntR family transcriptional regulator [Lentisphaerota bacterium]
MPKARYKEIIDSILRQISEGKLSPGSRIESIREICDHYGVSSIVALRVFKELSEAGVIERRNGSGYFVSSPRTTGKGDKLVCLFRPLRDYNSKDNFGNRIIFGMMEEAFLNGLTLVFPPAARFLRGKTPSEKETAEMAEELSRIPDAAGILVDMRIDDDMLQKYILPAAGGIPVAVVGRQSKLPHVMSSIIPHAAAGRDAACLALAGKAEYICHLTDLTLPDSGRTTEAFLAHLTEHDFPRERILLRKGCDTAAREECISIFNEILALIKISPGKVFIFSAVDNSAEYFKRYISDNAQDLRPGRDYSLLGFGGYAAQTESRYRLATFTIDTPELGRKAVKLLLQSKRISSDLTGTVNYKLDFNDTV